MKNNRKNRKKIILQMRRTFAQVKAQGTSHRLRNVVLEFPEVTHRVAASVIKFNNRTQEAIKLPGQSDIKPMA